jgi:hypothetical protein
MGRMSCTWGRCLASTGRTHATTGSTRPADAGGVRGRRYLGGFSFVDRGTGGTLGSTFQRAAWVVGLVAALAVCAVTPARAGATPLRESETACAGEQTGRHTIDAWTQPSAASLPGGASRCGLAFDPLAALSAFPDPVTTDRVGTPSLAATSDPTGKVGLSAAAWAVPTYTPRLEDWAADGFAHVRIDVLWKDVEKIPGIYDWSSTDETMALLVGAGLTVLPVLDSTAPAYQSIADEDLSPPTDAWAYARWAAAVVERYAAGGAFWSEHPDLTPRPVEAVEIWNEPYNVAFWRTGPDVEEYRTLFVAAAQAVRMANADIAIGLEVVPRYRRDGRGDDVEWARPLLSDPTVRGLTDFLSVHPYPSPKDKDPSTDSDAVYGFAMVAGLHDMALSEGWVDPRVWITEIGFPSELGNWDQTRHNRDAVARAFHEWGSFVDRYYLFTPGNSARWPEEFFMPGTSTDRGTYAAVSALVRSP